ncbi:rho GTPase-activating protein 45-like isoform X2 [Liolophura sinensis]|uniref:rho GTPase-activating protein 45-like isoform X2 n=1 Tax=Liolophura sinensis TaxID=3198878 RepID=UPI0031587294
MSAVGRKLTLNFNKLRKKLTDVPSDASQVDQQENYLHLPSMGHCDSGDGGQTSPREGSQRSANLTGSPKQKSISMCSISRQESDMIGQDDIMKLTQEVKCFSDALALLKSLFTEPQESSEEVRVLAHERLGEVLNLLKSVLQTYQALNSTDVFSASGTLIAKIKNYSYEEEVEEEKRQLCDAIDQLALAFSSSVSEYLMGDTEVPEEGDVKTKSCDNLASVPGELTEGEFKQGHLSAEDVNMILAQLEAGVDLALQRAKAWSKYAKDVVSYIERKCQFESDYAKNLTRLAQSMKQPLTEEGFLPLQSVYCTSLSQDLEYASTSQATCTLLHGQKFVEPMNARRAEHDKVRKILKEVWNRENKKMHDAVTNLRKAKSMYIQRHQEYEKAKELSLKTETEMLNQSGGAALSKIDKRKRLEEDALHRAAEAETTYKACVAEANIRQEEMAKVKKVVLAKLQEEISLSDEMMKKVTMDYFQLQIAVSAPVPVQYQTLCETSHDYEPGSQYAEFVRRLPVSARRVHNELFTFEPYIVDRQQGERKPSNQSNGSGGSEQASQESSPQSSPRKQQRGNPLRAWGQGILHGSDTDSASSNRSMDNSPSASPRGGGIRHLDQPDDDGEDRLNDSGIGQSVEMLVGQGRKTIGGRGGRDSDFQGICSRLGNRRNTFGVDFSEQVKQTNTDVPPIITLCLEEIEKRGMDIRGIYRVSGVKSKVENLCLKFDDDPEGVDLSEENPNVISNVLKLYLRQLPEPLLTFRLYPDFIRIAKEDMTGTVDHASTVERLRGMAKRLPKSNYKTSAMLMLHLKRMAGNVEINQMSTNNLGIVFGPTLLRPREGTASLTSLVDTPHQTHMVELLIDSAEEIFGSDKDLEGGENLATDDSTLTEEELAAGEGTEEGHHQEVVVRTTSKAAVESVFRDNPSNDHKELGQEFSLPGSASHSNLENQSPESTSDVGSDDELDLDLQDDEYLANLLPDDSLRSSLRAAMTPCSSRENNSVQCMQIFILTRTGE